MIGHCHPGSAVLRRFCAPGELDAVGGGRAALAALLRARLELRMLGARLAMGLARQALPAAERLIQNLDEDRLPRLAAECLGLLAEASLMHSDYPGMERASRRAIALYQRSGDLAGEASCLNSLGVVCEDTGRPEQGLELYRQALQRYRTLDDQRGIGNSLVNAATVLGGLGRAAESEPCFLQAIGILEDCGDLVTLGFAYSNYSVLLLRSKRWNDAASALERSRRIRERIGDRYGLAFSLSNIASELMRRGRWREAAAVLQESIGLREGIGERLFMSMDLLHLALLWQRMGRFAEADPLLQRALALGRELDQPEIAARGLLQAAEGCWLQNDIPAMERQLAAVQAEPPAAQSDRCLLRARCALEQGNAGEAAAALDALAPQSEALRTGQRCELHLLRARLAELGGAASETVGGEYAQAIAAAREDDDVYLKAVGLYHQGSWQQRAGAPWLEDIDRAEVIFRKLGAAPWLERIKAMKNALP